MENSRVADQLPPRRQLREHALRIWRAGVDAARPELLVPQSLRVKDGRLLIGNPANEQSDHVESALPLDAVRRIVVVGGGKAAAGMATAVENVLGPKLMAEKQLTGWINVPARDTGCQFSWPMAGEQPAPQRIHLHVARPAGVNEPTPDGVAGSLEILRLVASLGPDDLCLCLISGGGSALMPAPALGISLADKLAVTRHLSAAGATIEQLNTVRKQLSQIKGGGLLRACRAGRLLSLIISDVLGDPLDIIASGPTVPDSSTPRAALQILELFHAREAGISPAVFDHLRRAKLSPALVSGPEHGARPCHAVNIIIGNNATAVEAAAEEARQLGYATATESAARSEGPADEVGRQLAERALEIRRGTGPACLVSGGEPVVTLIEESHRGLGGRNQQLVLAALMRLAQDGANRIALLSGGTDGEDGPTDAAGAFLDADILSAARRLALDPADYLARNDAYHCFAPLDALLRTGPTGTNVCDLRVVVAGGKMP